jgi:hypothetical protein
VHSAAVLRLTGTERSVAEIAAVAEHVASLTAAAAAFNLRPDVPQAATNTVATVALLTETSAGEAVDMLVEIRRWARDVLGIDHIPAVWRALAHLPRLLESTWRKDRLVLGAGVLEELVKWCAALAIAQFRQSEYWIAYLTHGLRTRCSLTDRDVVEVAGAVMHYISFNTIAHGMRLDPPMAEMVAADVAPGGRFERYVPGARFPSRPGDEQQGR